MIIKKIVQFQYNLSVFFREMILQIQMDSRGIEENNEQERIRDPVKHL